MWHFPNLTQTFGPWWEPLRFCAPSSTSGLVCQFSCFFSKWNWLAILVGSPWIMCQISYLSLTEIPFVTSRTISLRSWLLMSWLMVCHLCSTGMRIPACHSTSSLTPPGSSHLSRICWPVWRESTKLFWNSCRPRWMRGPSYLFPRRGILSMPWTINILSFLVFLLCVWNAL